MCPMNRKEFILSGAGAFFIASAGKAFGADAPSNRVRLALVGCRAWLETCKRTPGCTGIMYTSWRNKYKLLAPFGELVRKGSE